MAKIPFNVDANTARLIGRENVSKLEGAIIEIIKNAYDADASLCVLYYENSSETLWIVDNGCGMDEKTIRKQWMSIGYSTKDIDVKSEKGRIKTGAKGIGRFALDRLGSICTMYTSTRDKKVEWNVDWESFIRGVNINEVFADLEEIDFIKNNVFSVIINEECKNLIKSKFKTGTAFKVRKLRDSWDEKFLGKLRNNLSSLIPPSLNNSFQVFLFDEKSSKNDAQIISDLMSSFDYSLDFKVSKNGEINVVINRNEFDFGSKFEYVMSNAGFSQEDREYFNGETIKRVSNVYDLGLGITESNPYLLGSFSGRICFYKIVSQEKNEEKYYYKPFEQRKSLIKKYGGIKIYRDGFRVRPYGESGTPQFDWLLLSARHYNSGWSVGSKAGPWTADSSQLIGEINISRLNKTLNDQANREGIFEDENFMLFKDIIVKIISFMEDDRQSVCRKLNALWERDNKAKLAEENIRKQYQDFISKNKFKDKKVSSNSSDNAYEYVHVSDAHKAIEGKNAQLQDLEDENRLLRSLATTGIAVNTYMHEIRALIHDLKMYSKRASEAYRLRNDINDAIDSINQVRKITKDFESWFQVTIETTRADKRKSQKINIIELISDCIDSWKKSLGNDIEFNCIFDSDVITYICFPYEIESIFHNLISNSYKSFKRSNTINKQINVVLTRKEEKLLISYSDNGEGLTQEFKKNPDKILQQMVTGDIVDGKKIGTGLGMWIINNIVNDYKGKLSLEKNLKSETGFYVDIIL